mmetsp:Transcript_28920/g.86031  ORF Transcript_28920/g.86031 Transcript_28920/m.86031 type:complete len:272 (+) Transcript_28920:368-1183(+)
MAVWLLLRRLVWLRSAGALWRALLLRRILSLHATLRSWSAAQHVGSLLARPCGPGDGLRSLLHSLVGLGSALQDRSAAQHVGGNPLALLRGLGNGIRGFGRSGQHGLGLGLCLGLRSLDLLVHGGGGEVRQGRQEGAGLRAAAVYGLERTQQLLALLVALLALPVALLALLLLLPLLRGLAGLGLGHLGLGHLLARLGVCPGTLLCSGCAQLCLVEGHGERLQLPLQLPPLRPLGLALPQARGLETARGRLERVALALQCLAVLREGGDAP